MVGELDDPGARLQAVDDAVRRIEFEGKAHAMLLRYLAAGPEIGGGFLERARRVLPGRGHHEIAAQRHGVGAGLVQHLEQPLALLALGEDQAVLGTDARRL